LISKDDIDKIFEAAKIEEVVGDYVTLKKRGVNLIGLCPFHDEKTPSFYVSPAKGIYKCFGCGKGGHSVNFIMEKEAASYPEALRVLAKKYNIDIAEEEQTPEQLQVQNDKESLYVVLSFAQKNFTENLYNTDEGKAIGLSYFKERGFREDIVQKFNLGYSINNKHAFTDVAIAHGHKMEYLVKAGLTIEYAAQSSSTEGAENQAITNSNNNSSTDVSTSGKSARAYADRFWGRVMFPVHNASGRVIAFGGRTLRTDKKIAKYINSPETEVYHKSDVLYGLYYAKKEIIHQDNCFLVEGYTDVISMHQAGIENVVASSGTSLTTGQIKLIRRFTNNITILYDGDSAGIKASFRGIDLILEEGLNVKVLLFPDGEDPDSYSKKVNSEELKLFIKNNTKDFISFKTSLLMGETENDPIKKAQLIKEIVESIALIPEAIFRSVYVKECSRIMDVEEQILLNELNKIRNKRFNEKLNEKTEAPQSLDSSEYTDIVTTQEKTSIADTEPQERKIIELLLNHGEQLILVDSEEVDERGKHIQVETHLAHFIIAEINAGGELTTFSNPIYLQIFNEFVTQLENNTIPNYKYFLEQDNPQYSNIVVNIIQSPYSLSNWEVHGITVNKEDDNLQKTAQKYVYTLAGKRLEMMIDNILKKLKDSKEEEDIMQLMQEKHALDEHKKTINSYLGRIIVK
jgi:DNA primase